MRKDYQRFAALVNEGARDMGFADTGEMWRSGYDMSPAELAAETDRLWGQVKPLYEQLHCYARTKLDAKYGTDKGSGQRPAARAPDGQHVAAGLGQPAGTSCNLIATGGRQPRRHRRAGSASTRPTTRAQLLAKSSPAATDERVEAEREAQLDIAKQMTERAQDFYTSLGMPKLPESYWEKTQFIKPRDRDVVCHASAWDMNIGGDVRTKMCIKPNEEDFTTIYHELGHVYYYLAYNKLPPLFQAGAHDGFHEAIGDTIVLAMTPKYLQSIGLVGEQQQSNEALINAQMRMALAKVSFLPFGLMIDRWRWGVFDGSITPGQLQQGVVGPEGEVPGRGAGDAARRGVLRSGREVPRAGQHAVHALLPLARAAVPVLQGAVRRGRLQGPAARMQLLRQQGSRREIPGDAEQGRQPAVAEDDEGAHRRREDGRLARCSSTSRRCRQWLKQQNEGKTCGWQAPATAAAAAPAAKPAAAPPKQG